MSQIFSDTMKTKGWKALYEGMAHKLIHSSLTYAIIFSTKEKFVRYSFAFLLFLIAKNETKFKEAAQKQAQ